MICIFDCETIPDNDSLKKIIPDLSGDELEVSKKAMSYFEENYNSSFLPVCFHKVVAISAVITDDFGKFQRLNTIKADSEEERLSSFINFINRSNPRLVSYNGRGFDLPMIMIRAMRYNLSAFSYFETNSANTNKNKWQNYRSRYDGIFHLDLLDHISEFKSVSNLKLDFLCSSLNLPGKYDISGDQVLELFYNKKIDKINEYCESDVLNTYWLFLKYELLRGNILKSDYLNNLALLKEYLNKEKSDLSYTPVFSKFIDKELSKENK